MKNEVLGLAQNTQPSSENQDPQVLDGTWECNGRDFFFFILKSSYSWRKEERMGEWIELDCGHQVQFPRQAKLGIFSD